MDGNVHTFKARLVAKGYTQTYDINYGETFSHVVNIRAIRVLLAMVLFYDYEIWKMDVKIAFLNGHLSEDVYMVQPEGFVDLKHPNKVCKQQRSIYGLKQASRSWKRRFDEEIKKKFKMENSKCGSVPMQEKPNYKKSQGAKIPSEVKRMQRVPYVSSIGFIIYAQNTSEVHWIAVKTILKYLSNTKDMVLVYGVAMSSTEVGYIVAAEASMEAVWMRKFINGHGNVMPSNKRPMEMLCDNAPAIAIANDPEIMKGASHYQRKYHYICELIRDGEIILKKVHTDDNLVDQFTKPMPYSKHFEHAIAIGVFPSISLMWICDVLVII
ncbi:retrovirus-related pol polyprotein from transposon TNT 1-94 [Tanacetum coccineum]